MPCSLALWSPDGLIGSPDVPALSSSIPRDGSNLADSGWRGSPGDQSLVPALLVMQRAPPGAGAQAALCKVLLERAGTEHPSAAVDNQGA